LGNYLNLILLKDIYFNINKMKILSWNVNGIRSNILDFTNSSNKKTREINDTSALSLILKKYSPDIICFQETRLGEDNYKLFIGESIETAFPYRYWSSSKKEKARSGNRYSGTSIWCKNKPDNIIYEIEGLDNQEGRVIQIEYGNNIIITTYTPNAGSNWDYRLNIWEPAINKYISKLIKKKKNIIYCGDNNIANKEDVWFGEILEKKLLQEQNKDATSDITKKLKRLVKSKEKLHDGRTSLCGYSLEEREAFKKLIAENNLVDCFRFKNPKVVDKFSWFNIRIRGSFKSNKGWLIDRFLVNKKLRSKIKDCKILYDFGTHFNDKFISDHLPVYLEIKL